MEQQQVITITDSKEFTMAKIKSCVVITDAEPMNYLNDYVALPSDYGSGAYYGRRDIAAIMKAVHDSLESLDRETGFTEKLKGKKALIKPNLVGTYIKIGFRDREYPESTDPRVLDAVVDYIKRHAASVTIVESSGRGFPTRAAFKITGIDRIAKRHGAELLALEEQPVDRYILPKAKVMKEIIVPRIFSEVARGEAFYISLPKMKTNLYTGVTLGFKNAMGTIPYNLRQRNHNYNIEEKLVDMLCLFKPDLTVIDGIVGAEGNCPGPVFPVKSNVIISGTNSVEVDRIATAMMGIDPSSIKLMRCADARGFGDRKVKVIGKQRTIPFKQANPSLMDDDFRSRFPLVTVLVGHRMKHAPVPGKKKKANAAFAREMELACRGGCLATVKFGFEMVYHEGVAMKNPLTVIIGEGALVDGTAVYYDGDGKPYTPEDIAGLPGAILAVGSCAGAVADIADAHCDGCMPFPNTPHILIHKLTGSRCRIMGPANRQLFTIAGGLLAMTMARKKLIRSGHRLDCELPLQDALADTPDLDAADREKDFVPWPFPPLSAEDRKRLIKFENYMMLKDF